MEIPAKWEKRIIKDAVSMRQWGVSLASLLQKGDVVAIRGPFGVGKTTLVQGIALGLGINEPVDSPSFLSAKVYQQQGCMSLYHLDAYRLQSSHLDADLYAEMIEGEGICVIEWAERLIPWLPGKTIWIDLQLNESGLRVAGIGRGLRFVQGGE
ncbi:tRNA (adenosine(37)-N6)-threonylcarbamoyltransferase complex ATPase subunit type 1 TsaE [Pasteuria penetrans]|uniref:tRNA (adenosine(37)-N6)-threonylcarbamoyltransferase complex ATPase subunit type 1 TsaE n=1 Tax=Pasteuria penetrans TaxID=86005 RepID=UPI000F9DF748|nr:tRNA (adenosine(37)-N6)-threonylcarbamoyltransferase complex ATPase subunit type 1 TsaE [Pasteuria penetrans]